jgi:hypothetical protein
VRPFAPAWVENGPKGAWTGPGPPETMRDRGGQADLGGGVGPPSCSRMVLLTTPVPCRRASSIPTDGEGRFCELSVDGVLRSSFGFVTDATKGSPICGLRVGGTVG